MHREDEIIIYLKQITDAVEVTNQKIDLLDKKIDQVEESLNRRIDEVEERLSHRIDELELRIDKLELRIDEVEASLNRRIDEVEASLNRQIAELRARIEEVRAYLEEKIDMIEKALDTEIDKVYQIAHKNEYNIEMLLLPYNDRNLHVNDELAKMARYDERMDEIETVLESHSEAIQKLQLAMA